MHSNRFLARLRFCVLVAALGLASPAGAHLTLMHGFADYTSALLWILADAPGAIEVAWQAADGARRTLNVEASASHDNVVLARLTGLLPGTAVQYVVTGDSDVRQGTLRTQAHWLRPNQAADISIAFGSCFFLADPDPRWGGQHYAGEFEIFDAIAGKQPDLMVWMGDNLYFQAQDELDAAAMAARYKRQRTFGPLQKLLTATAHVAIWDDHDYGPNDADMSYVMKGTSLELFQRYWANPTYGLPGTPGVFGRARVGDVDIFLLDDRWYRSANDAIDGPDKTMLGTQQLAWLRNALIYSKAPVKLVVNGSQMWNEANRFEGWNHFLVERNAFAQWLVAQRIDGVIFLSGDRHFSELLRVPRDNAPPLYEFTSSPLTSGPFDIKDAAERNNPATVPGTFVAKRQFGMIRVSGPGNDRRIALESYDAKGTLLWRHEIAASELAFHAPQK